MMSIPEKTPFVHSTKIGSCCQLLRESTGARGLPRHSELTLPRFVRRLLTGMTGRVSGCRVPCTQVQIPEWFTAVCGGFQKISGFRVTFVPLRR
jgi:hypothetical protein